jgi:hypothetical protein
MIGKNVVCAEVVLVRNYVQRDVFIPFPGDISDISENTETAELPISVQMTLALPIVSTA